MRFYADYPDGTTEELINVAKYNYNWQLSYLYKEPKLVPAGTQIRVVGAFDNSSQNPANPDPERTVPWGNESWDEMFFGVVNYKFTNQAETIKSSLSEYKKAGHPRLFCLYDLIEAANVTGH